MQLEGPPMRPLWTLTRTHATSSPPAYAATQWCTPLVHAIDYIDDVSRASIVAGSECEWGRQLGTTFHAGRLGHASTCRTADGDGVCVISDETGATACLHPAQGIARAVAGSGEKGRAAQAGWAPPPLSTALSS